MSVTAEQEGHNSKGRDQDALAALNMLLWMPGSSRMWLRQQTARPLHLYLSQIPDKRPWGCPETEGAAANPAALEAAGTRVQLSSIQSQRGVNKLACSLWRSRSQLYVLRERSSLAIDHKNKSKKEMQKLFPSSLTPLFPTSFLSSLTQHLISPHFPYPKAYTDWMCWHF